MHLSTFTRRLVQTIKWVEQLTQGFDYAGIHYGSVLRQTNPLIDGTPFYATDTDFARWNRSCFEVSTYKAALHAVLAVRDSLLEDTPSRTDALLQQGRILCFTTMLTTDEGIAIIESNCFLDESDVPPLDTWFALQEQSVAAFPPVLYCWIPRLFEFTINAARKHQIMNAYGWLDEEDPAFYARIVAELQNPSAEE
ncbi:hypothetical protein [Hymenobacter norwichensis]|uniref:hypothetical protein n=1 Tax=Hymenobacter norwichensis TaxID=223903 RepID=UPI0003B308F4|nr:hypothetical protein [Hymenobacter norwichensis]